MKRLCFFWILIVGLLPAQAGQFHTEVTVFQRGDHAGRPV